MIKQRKYFEICAGIGRRNVSSSDFPYETKDLLDDMAYYRVHGALVTDVSALDYSFVAGNRDLCATVKNNPRLIGAAQIPSTALLETDNANYFEGLHKNGIRAFYASPVTLRHTLFPSEMECVARFLIEKNMPLLIRWGEMNPAELIAFLAAYPDLHVVLIGAHWGSNRILFPMLERFANLLFEVGSNQANDILETVKKHFGIERVLYGTDWPLRPMGTIKGLVEYADISEVDKDAVAAGNALRLLGLELDSFSLYDDVECRLDEIALEADVGKPISVPVFDAHTHMCPSEDKTVSGLMMLNSDCDSMVRKMNRLGIDSVIIAPWQGICTDGRAGNAQALHAAQKYPGRFYGFSTCNIHYSGDLTGWREYHEKHPDIFVGIKPYWPYQKFDLTTDICREWYNYADKQGLLLLLHTDGNDTVLMQAEELIIRYPGIKLILAHSGTDWHVARRNTELAKRYPNVYLEITYTTCTRGTIEYMVSEAGADKVLYGSDMPMRDPAPQLAWGAYAKISIADKKKILAGNIIRLLAEIKGRAK